MSDRSMAWAGAALATLIVAAGWYWFQRGYGQVSELGYQYATAMFSACNQQDEARLQRIAAMVEQSTAAGELPQQEAAWLRQIIDMGLAGHWEDASEEVRQLMEDQLTIST